MSVETLILDAKQAILDEQFRRWRICTGKAEATKRPGKAGPRSPAPPTS